MKKDGAPIEWVPLQPAFGRPNGVAVAKNASHPYAAMLLVDFILSPEGQQIFNERGRVPASTKVESNLNDFEYKMIDPEIVLDEWEKWNKIWSDLYFNGQPAPKEEEK
jgi:iron(III) transport system substrate-binding protein